MSYVSEVTADSPVLWWRLGEAAGTTAADASGNGIAGTYTNSPTLGVGGALTVSGDTDTAVAFAAASSQYAVAATNPASLQLPQFTLECWVKITATPGANQFLIGRARNYTVYFKADGKIYIGFPVLLNDIAPTGVVPLNQWNHYAVTCDGTNVVSYLNGVQANTGVTGGTIDTNLAQNFAIAQDHVSVGLYLNGSLDEVAAYSTVLSAARILAHYNAGITPPALPPARTKPPLALHAEGLDFAGTSFRWDANAKAKDRPQGIGFSTKVGEGFDTSSLSLPRRYDREFSDLNLLDEFALVGDDGSVAYEGQVESLPRSLGESHLIAVNARGWMNHARRRTFTAIPVDRDLTRVVPMSRARKISLGTTWGQVDSQNVTDATGLPAVELLLTSPWSLTQNICEADYDSGPGQTISKIYYDIQLMGLGTGDASLTLKVGVADDDNATNIAQSGDLKAASTGTFTPTTPRRWANLILTYSAAHTGDSGIDFGAFLRRLAFYGNTGLTTRTNLTSGEPDGLYASDVIKWIAQNYAPKLSVAGVQDTTYPVSQIAWHDEITPADAFLELNRYHLWLLGVWEGKTLTFAPMDFSKNDWEVRASDWGTTIDLQGDSVTDTANGIIVHFTDFMGVANRITPDDDSTLQDLNPTLPANIHGEKVWTSIDISDPCLSADALQIGRAALAEFNRPKRPGTITVKGHIKDGSGHWKQGWKVRAGETVSIADNPNPLPHLITETSWDQDSTSLTMTLDNATPRLQAVLDRQANALQAAGLA